MNSIFMKLYVTWPTWPEGHIHCTSEIWIFEVIFVVFRLMKNIIFNKTESFVGRNTSNHASQIFCSKSNWNYVSLIFPPWDNRGQNNEQSECLLRPQSRFKHKMWKKSFVEGFHTHWPFLEILEEQTCHFPNLNVLIFYPVLMLFWGQKAQYKKNVF
jgi:hypothetical protein